MSLDQFATPQEAYEFAQKVFRHRADLTTWMPRFISGEFPPYECPDHPLKIHRNQGAFVTCWPGFEVVLPVRR